jgi:hypothetical protein
LAGEILGEGVTVQVFSATDKIGVQDAQKRLVQLLHSPVPPSMEKSSP